MWLPLIELRSRKRVHELGSSGDSEFRIDSVQVGADRMVREEDLLGNLAV